MPNRTITFAVSKCLSVFAHEVVSSSDQPLIDYQWIYLAAARALLVGKVRGVSDEVRRAIFDTDDALPGVRDIDDLISTLLSESCV